MNLFGWMHIITVILIVLKLGKVITWSWWLVFTPSLIVAVIIGVFFLMLLLGTAIAASTSGSSVKIRRSR